MVSFVQLRVYAVNEHANQQILGIIVFAYP